MQNRKSSAASLAWRSLSEWFLQEQRVLPWRENPSPYRVWISEIMLQQTQVITVLPYFERFVGRFPTVESLAQAPESEVLLHWAGLGYYSRARNVHKAAQRIVTRGSFPISRSEWLEVPGVGPYTAGAILSIAFNQVEPLLDGNVERVLARFRRIPREGDGLSAYKDRLWRASYRALRLAVEAEAVEPRIFNQALMELGARICTPKKPLCLLCPLRSQCKANLHGDVLQFPSQKPKKQWLQVHESRVLLFDARAARVGVLQAPAGSWRAGLWDLPEVLPEPLTQEATDQGQVEIKTVVTRHKITRTVRVLSLAGLNPALQRESGLTWVNPEYPEVALGSAFRKSWNAARAKLFEAHST